MKLTISQIASIRELVARGGRIDDVEILALCDMAESAGVDQQDAAQWRIWSQQVVNLQDHNFPAHSTLARLRDAMRQVIAAIARACTYPACACGNGIKVCEPNDETESSPRNRALVSKDGRWRLK